MGASKNGDNYPWRVTPYIVICWVLAACGGLMFGYDIGISGMIHNTLLWNCYSINSYKCESKIQYNIDQTLTYE